MKTSNAIALNYDGLSVHFTEEAWFNATEAADKFGKRVDNWFANAETKQYIELLCEQTHWKPSEFVLVKEGRTGGTWLHPKLAVLFARWLDLRFAIWCDDQIYSLLRGTHPSSNPPRDALKKDKRESHHAMMDAKRFVLEDILGLETGPSDFIKENFFCNRALTGMWEALDETSLDNYDMRLLKAIRDRNAVLIPHYPRQKEPAADGRSRRELLDAFVAEYRSKHPRLKLVK
jgi:hypothetical protein